MEKSLLKYKEKTVHGTSLSPFAKYHTDISELLPFYPIHWHEEMEILKVQSGKGAFGIDGKRYLAEEGDIIILSPFVMHSISSFDNEKMSLDAVVFNLRLLETGGADVCTLKYFAPLLAAKHSVPCIVRPTDSWYPPFDLSMTAVLMCDDRQSGAELEIKANLYWMFYHMYRNRLINVQPDVLDDKRCYTVKRALEFIRANYMNGISVESIAAHCGYSDFYTMKLFKKFTGITCIDYVNNYRLNVAGQQLLVTDDDVSAVAYQVGFNNISYFNRQFKSQYGMTPKQFRGTSKA